MTEQHVKEQISRAYARAIAARAGILLKESEIDYGLDGSFRDVDYDAEHGRYSENGFGIDFQLKATKNIIPKGNKLIYDLEVKNYRDLIKTQVGTPRILIVYSMPAQIDEWITVTDEDTTLRYCAWWGSLKGQKETNNKKKKRIVLPVSQRLTPVELRRLINLVKEGADL